MIKLNDIVFSITHQEEVPISRAYCRNEWLVQGNRPFTNSDVLALIDKTKFMVINDSRVWCGQFQAWDEKSLPAERLIISDFIDSSD